MGHGCSSRYDDTHRGFVRHAQKVGMIVLVCFAVWAATGFGFMWPLWVMVIGGVKLAAHARRVYGRSDDDAGPDDEPAPEDDFIIV